MSIGHLMFLKATRQLFPYFSASCSPASAVISWKSVTKGGDAQILLFTTLSFLFPDSALTEIHLPQ